MPTPPLSYEAALEAVEAYRAHGSKQAAADAIGISRQTIQGRLKVAARYGLMLDERPAMPGYEVSRVSTDGEGNVTAIQQRPEAGEVYEVPAGHIVKGKSTLIDADGRIRAEWVKTAADAQETEQALRAIAEGLKDEIPCAAPVEAPEHTDGDLLSAYILTDQHLGMLAWHEEAGEDYDLTIAEDLVRRFISSAAAMSPPSGTAVLAQLGDFLHHDSHKPLTPEHGHVLDSDSRFPKIVRAAIRVLRWAVARLLERHGHVHVVMADANHDPAAGVWLREMFAAFYENEPRVTVDTSANTYYCYEFGQTALFFHHGHRRKPKEVDKVFAGQFRQIYGRTKFAYAHMGHRHADELLSTNLMKVEQHETLAAKDAFASLSGYLSGRSAKAIHYHRDFGEVARTILTPAMLGNVTER